MPDSTHIIECVDMQRRHGQRYVMLCTVKSVYRMCAYVWREQAGECSAVHSEVGVQNVKGTSLFGFVSFIILQSQNTRILLQSLPL
jgi:hypothetical protein